MAEFDGEIRSAVIFTYGGQEGAGVFRSAASFASATVEPIPTTLNTAGVVTMGAPTSIESIGVPAPAFLYAIPDPILGRQWSIDGTVGSDSITLMAAQILAVGAIHTTPTDLGCDAHEVPVTANASPTSIESIPAYFGWKLPLTTRYKLRGWRPNTMDFETWIALDPLTANPSGQPIQDVTVSVSWKR